MLRRLVASLACLATVGVLLVPSAQATIPEDTSATSAGDPADGDTGASGWVTDPGGAGARGGHWQITPLTNMTVDEQGRLQFAAAFQLGTVIGGPVYLERWPATSTIPNPACEGSGVNSRWEDGRLDDFTQRVSNGAGLKHLSYTLSGSLLHGNSAGRYRLHAWTGAATATERNYTCFAISVRLARPVDVVAPQAVTVDERGTATFTSTAATPFAAYIPPTVQWQRSTDNGATWTDVAGATSGSYSVANVTAAMNGDRYRAVWQRRGTNQWQLASDTVETAGATLTVRAAPRISVGPASVTVNPGQTATFAVTATGQAPLTYQWQRSTNGGGSWENLTGQTGASMTTSQATDLMNGYRYRVQVNNSVGPAVTSGVATLTVRQPPSITTHPRSQTVPHGQTATFSVVARGTAPLTYQWQRSTDGGGSWEDLAGQTGASMTTSQAIDAMDGYRYRVVVNNATNTPDTSNAATLTVGTAPAITSEPADQRVRIGDTASFAIGVGGDPAPTIQWQLSTDGGATWYLPTGNDTATSPEFVTGARRAEHDGNLYRAVVRNRAGSLTSRVATLRVDPQIPLFRTHPVSRAVAPGEDAVFTVEIANTAEAGNPRVQWEESTDGASTWVPIAGATGLSYTVPDVTEQHSGRQYRAILTNSIEEFTRSSAARLTVEEAPAVTLEPVSQTAQEGATVWFDATGSGTPAPSVQWWTAPAGSDAWEPVPGGTSTRLTVVAEDELHGRQYKAVFSNGVAGPAETRVVTLTVLTAPWVVTEPDDARVRAGDTATFTVEAAGRPEPAIQWQWSTNGTTWNRIDSETATTAEYTTSERNVTQDGMLFRARLTNQGADGTTRTTYTREATLTVDPQVPRFRTHPTDTEVPAGTDARFTAAIDNTTAAGNPRVHWEYSDDGDTWTPVDGATTLTLTLPAATTDLSGRQYRAVLTNSLDEATTSEHATLTVTQAPWITQEPTSQTVQENTTVELVADASGSPTPSVQWYSAPAGTTDWVEIPTATDRTLTFTAIDALHDRQYKAVFSNGVGDPAETQPATLTVLTAPRILAEPEDARVRINGRATFTVEATGRPEPAIQWQWSPDGIEWFLPEDNATENDAEFVTSVRGAVHDGYFYRAALTNERADGTTQTTHTRAALLTVDPNVPRFGTQPADATVPVGDDAGFTVTVGNPVGANNPAVHWEFSDDGDTWTRVDGATDLTLTVPGVTLDLTGRQYRAVLTNTLDETATSEAATLTVTQAPWITLDPTSQTAQDGDTVELTADADGTPAPSVQWYSAPAGSPDWTAIPAATDRTLTLTAADELHDRRYKAVFTNGVGDPAETQPATLTVLTAPRVLTEPDDVRVRAGDTATFTVETAGRPAPAIQWQWRMPNTSSWSDATSATATSAEYTSSERNVAQDGMLFRARLRNQGADGTTHTTFTREAILTVDPQIPRFATHPTDTEVPAGTDAQFTATIANRTAAGDPGVHWEHSDDGDTWTPVDGATTLTLTVPAATPDLTGRLYRAFLTNSLDEATPSEHATLTVTHEPVRFTFTLTPRVVLVDRLPAREETP